MAYTNGSSRTTIRSGLDLVLTWTKTGSSGLNSLINVKLSLEATYGSYPINAPGSPADAQIIVNGTTYKSNSIDLSSTYGKKLMDINVSVAHESNGKQTLRLFASLYSANGIYLGGSRWSYSTIGTLKWELPDLFQPSSYTLGASQYTLGSSIPVTISRGESTHRIYFFATLSGTVIDTWDFPSGSTLPTNLGAGARQLTTAPKILTSTDRGVVSLTMEIYAGDTRIAYQTETILGILPASYKPKMTSLLTTAINPASFPTAYKGDYVKTLSRVKVQLVAEKHDENTKWGNTQTQKSWYEVQVDGTNYYGDVIQSNPIKKTSITVWGRIRDSRGRWSDWMSKTITASDYVEPTVTNISAQRYTSGVDTTSASPSPSGGNLGIYALIKGTAPMKITVKSKNLTTNTITTHLSVDNTTGAYTLNRIFAGFSVDYEFIVYLAVTDKYGQSINWQTKLPKGKFAFVMGKKGVGIGTIPPDAEGLYVDGPIYLNEIEALDKTRWPIHFKDKSKFFDYIWMEKNNIIFYGDTDYGIGFIQDPSDSSKDGGIFIGRYKWNVGDIYTPNNGIVITSKGEAWRMVNGSWGKRFDND